MGYLLIIYHSVKNTSIIYCAVVFFCDLANVPSRNPFVLLRCTFFRCRIRPVPVVFLLLALDPQLKLLVLALGYPHDAHTFFWMWYDLRPHRTHNVCDLLWRLPKLDVPLVMVIRF